MDYQTDRKLSYGGAPVEKWDNEITFTFSDQEKIVFTDYLMNIEDRHIFRLLQDGVNIFISEKIAAVIQENGLTGFAVYEIFSSEDAESIKAAEAGKKKFKVPYIGNKDLIELFFEWFDKLLNFPTGKAGINA